MKGKRRDQSRKKLRDGHPASLSRCPPRPRRQRPRTPFPTHQKPPHTYGVHHPAISCSLGRACSVPGAAFQTRMRCSRLGRAPALLPHAPHRPAGPRPDAIAEGRPPCPAPARETACVVPRSGRGLLGGAERGKPCFGGRVLPDPDLRGRRGLRLRPGQPRPAGLETAPLARLGHLPPRLAVARLRALWPPPPPVDHHGAAASPARPRLPAPGGPEDRRRARRGPELAVGIPWIPTRRPPHLPSRRRPDLAPRSPGRPPPAAAGRGPGAGRARVAGLPGPGLHPIGLALAVLVGGGWNRALAGGA